MKIKLTEQQHEIIKRVKRHQAIRKGINEQEWLAQQTRFTLAETENEGRHAYTINITVLSQSEQFTNEEFDAMSVHEYRTYILGDIKEKIERAFRTKEYKVNNIITQARGDIS